MQMTTSDRQKRILITGASGFIGGFLVKEALQRGYEVWAAIRPGSSHEHLQDERIRFIHLQYEDKASMTKQFQEIAYNVGAWHYVIHNAGLTKALHTKDFYLVNTHYTSVLVEALAKSGCMPDKFLLMSSLSSYGAAKDGLIRVNDEQRPDSVYGDSKRKAELLLKAQSYFPYIILCPTGVYGPGDKDYLIEIKSIKAGFDFKTGMKPQHLTFIYVKDLAVTAFHALERSSVQNSTYLVADGDVYTDQEFSEIVKKSLGKRRVFKMRIPMWICFITCLCSEWAGKICKKAMTLNTDKYKILRQRNWVCETERTFRDLAFKPQYNLQEGIAETILFSRENGLL